ncbi:MAG TPA: hypothetical protein VGF67_25830 [Ktedonobacteraceae bacterium]|jgi:hypothetical protein
MDGFRWLEGAHRDNQRDQGLEVGDGAAVAHPGTLDAEFFGLALDALAGRALDVDRVRERAGAVHQEASTAARLVMDVPEAAGAFGTLRILAGLTRGGGKPERTPIALSMIARGMSGTRGGMHTQPDGTARHRVRVKDGCGMSVEGNGGDAAMANGSIRDVPGIRSRASAARGVGYCWRAWTAWR